MLICNLKTLQRRNGKKAIAAARTRWRTSSTAQDKEEEGKVIIKVHIKVLRTLVQITKLHNLPSRTTIAHLFHPTIGQTNLAITAVRRSWFTMFHPATSARIDTGTTGSRQLLKPKASTDKAKACTKSRELQHNSKTTAASNATTNKTV